MRALAMGSALVVLLWFENASDSKELSAEVLRYLPSKGFVSSGPAEHFVGKKLFDYMNGGAELYLAYGFVDLGVREYQSGQQKALVAIYRMSRPEGAFGLYLTAANGQPLKLADISAVMSPGMLSFFKGNLYVRVVARSDAKTEKSRNLLRKLASHVALRIAGKAEPPAEVTLLPKGWTAGSLRYLINPDTAQTVWFNGEGRILLSEQARAFTAFYPGDQGDLQATRASYPSSAAALTACRKLAQKIGLKYAEKKHTCEVVGKDPDDLVHFLRSKGNVLGWIAGAPDVDTAKAWIEKIQLSE